MVADPEFVAGARKQQLDVEDPMSGTDLQDLVQQLNATPKDASSALVKLFTDYNHKN
jgi:hypothetical protein